MEKQNTNEELNKTAVSFFRKIKAGEYYFEAVYVDCTMKPPREVYKMITKEEFDTIDLSEEVPRVNTLPIK
jgi:hypothetical protein